MTADYPHAYWAAMDRLQAGGTVSDATAAARSAVRPGGTLQFDEHYPCRRAVAAAVEQYTKENVMELNQAQAVIQAVAEEFTAALRAKGHPEAHAEIWIGRDGKGQCTIYVAKAPLHIPYTRDLEKLVADGREKVAEMPHKDAEALAYADELAQPLFLMSEQYAQAAE